MDWRRALHAVAETRHSLRPAERRTGGRSLVAGANALFRAAEAERPPASRILADGYAARFAERHPLVQAIRVGRFVAPPLARELARLQVAHCTRHRALDALVAEALAEGFTQVVTLGAGYDTRPLRIGGPARWFEVDVPETAALKRRRLPESPATAIEADLIVDGLPLAGTGFDADAPACFVLEGLVHYLPAATLDALLATMGAGPRRRVLLSFIDPAMVPRASVAFTSLVKVVREAPRQYLTPEALAERAAPAGLRLTGHWPFAAQVAAFAPGARGRAVGVSQDVARLDRP